MVGTPWNNGWPVRRSPKRVARYAWPAGLAAAGGAWYAADSLRHRRESGHGYTLRGEVDVAEANFLRACEALTGAPVSYGNDLDLLVNGDQIFPAYLNAIRDAEETVNLLTYAYWKGDVAIEVADCLTEKARAGVECNVIIDALGGAQMDRRLLERMREAGVEISWFRPLKAYAVRRLENRTHRKLLIVDGKVGFTGGVGIAEEWTGNAQDPDHWRDTHVRVRGPVVRGLQGAFAENWLEGTGNVLAGDRYLPELDEVENGGPMQVVRSSATVGDTNAEALIYLALASAKKTIELTSAYFVPRPAFTDALVEAAERGVDMRILVPGSHIDKEFVRTAGRAAYDQLLEAGVRLFEYGPTMLHAKSLVIDGDWSCVGSINFDNRSFQLHDEIALCVQSERFAGELH
ncbi:MAG: phospholipase D-like domain-containing protein, partial [Thermoleophilaceae bacterium]